MIGAATLATFVLFTMIRRSLSPPRINPVDAVPEEKIGVRVECVFLVGADGKLIDLTAALPHTADEVEAAMHAK